MKQERNQNPQQKPYENYPKDKGNQADRPGYEDDGYLPGQRQRPIEAKQERQEQDPQTREDIQRAEQEGMVKHKEGNTRPQQKKEKGNQARRQQNLSTQRH